MSERNSPEAIHDAFRRPTIARYEELAQPFVDQAIDLIRPILTKQWAAALEQIEESMKRKHSGTGRIA